MSLTLGHFLTLGALLFALWLCWTQGLIATYVLSDPTWISQAILALFLAACGHCGLRAWWLARELERLAALGRAAAAGIETAAFPRAAHESREARDAAIAAWQPSSANVSATSIASIAASARSRHARAARTSALRAMPNARNSTSPRR